MPLRRGMNLLVGHPPINNYDLSDPNLTMSTFFVSACLLMSTISVSVCLLMSTISVSVCFLIKYESTLSVSVCLLIKNMSTIYVSVCLQIKYVSTFSVSKETQSASRSRPKADLQRVFNREDKCNRIISKCPIE